MNKLLAGVALSLGLMLVPGIAGAHADGWIRLAPGVNIVIDLDRHHVPRKAPKIFRHQRHDVWIGGPLYRYRDYDDRYQRCWYRHGVFSCSRNRSINTFDGP